MISIYENFRSHGFVSDARRPKHLRPPGIWEKLRTMYDLEALDERENAHAGLRTPSPEDEDDGEDNDEEDDDDEGAGAFVEFQLPEDDEDFKFGKLMWEKRFDPKSKDGPDLIEGLNRTWPIPGVVLEIQDSEAGDEEGGESEVEESEEAASPPPKGSKSSKKTAAKPAAPRRGTRKR
jgi:MRG-binding protein